MPIPDTAQTDAAAFYAMRAKVKSFKELAAWFEENPVFLLDAGILGPAAHVHVDISFFPGKYFMRVVNHHDILVKATIRGSATVSSHALLASEYQAGGDDDQFSFTHARTLGLSLMSWPLAAAIAASEQLIDGNHSKAEHYVPAFDNNLDDALSRHFPGFTTGRLRDLKQAGLLGLVGNNTADKEKVINLLFSVHTPGIKVDLPELVT